MSIPSMYRAVMGDAFDRLASPVRDFHDVAGHHAFHGQVEVGAPESFLARLLAVFLGTPLKAAKGRIRFEVHAEPGTEVWTRFFPDKTMRSTLKQSGHHITEQLGGSTLTFAVVEVAGSLEMRLEKLSFLGASCPGWLMPRVTAREKGLARQLHFQIHASLPVIGRVASYTGYLNIPTKDLQ